MYIGEVKNKEIWENFLLKCEEKTFLQSWNWGEFHERLGNKIWRLGIFEDVQHRVLHNVALVVKVAAKRGTFLLAQHNTGVSRVLIDKLKEIAEKEDCSFLRMAPLLPRNEENKKLFRGFGFREAPMHASAYEATWKLDITKTEMELLANMRKTTRYLIRQAEKSADILIEKSNRAEDIEIFQRINLESAKRQKFAPFSNQFIKNEFEIFNQDEQSLLFFGKYKGEVAAAALIIFWSDIAFYHQAASSAKYAKIPLPYLLQWEAIKESKARGCKMYDFWGYVDPKTQPRHPWAGPTLFKMGFGGGAHEYLKTQDLPLSKKYWLIYIFEKIRKIKRGL
ncbi:MAG: peptidoglycan bridge formation glycyltransferase FemA/FemB family protein [Candidatus Nealsonbacteria bacterium]|nr:peptidoglycan bridge formation glycyltransferase FemA/FemB family protein [Candidatus Nealsonbacteria bacterium]